MVLMQHQLVVSKFGVGKAGMGQNRTEGWTRFRRTVEMAANSTAVFYAPS